MKRAYFHRFPYSVVLYFFFFFILMENKDSIIRESHGDIGDAHAGNIVLYCCLIYVDNLWSV